MSKDENFLIRFSCNKRLMALTLRINVIFIAAVFVHLCLMGANRNLVRKSPETVLLNRTDCFNFRYQGSLTTPGCVEAVIWTIFKEPLVINTKTRDLILKTDSTRKVNNNFRTLMPVNDRKGIVSHMIHII